MNKTNKIDKIIILWFMISILPQVLGITRENSIGIYLKAILIVIFIGYIFFVNLRKGSKIEVNRVGIMIMLYYFINLLISNFIIKPAYMKNGFGVYVDVIVSTIYVFVFLGMYWGAEISKEKMQNILNIQILIVLWSCIYNIIKNYKYIGISLISNSSYEYEFASFFVNRNTFSFFIVLGIVSIYLKEKRNISLLIFFIINLILTNSRGGIFSIVIFMIIRSFLMNKKKIVREIGKIILLIVIIIIGIKILGLESYIMEKIVRVDSGVTSRDDIWKIGIESWKNGSIFWGNGETYAKNILINITGNSSFHNTYISLLVYGGVALLLFWLLLVKKAFEESIRIIQYDVSTGNTLIAFIVAYLAYSFVETNILFKTSAINVATTIIVVIIPHYYLNSYRSKKNE